MEVLGIDIGGSGIKGAIVDTTNGQLITDRHRIPTPKKAKPDDVAEVLHEVISHFNWQGICGCGFPAVIQNGVVKTAANIHDSWIGINADEFFTEKHQSTITVLNDADAAGIAEMKFGHGKGKNGVVLIITIGTGLGTSFFINGQLFPNTELGHIEIKGMKAEKYASDAARKDDDLKWEAWGKRFNEYLNTMHRLFWPELIILGGGASKKLHKFENVLMCKAPVVAASMQNNAGIIGAAINATNS